MACRLLSAKPLSEPMLKYNQLDPKKHNSVKYWSKFEKMRLNLVAILSSPQSVNVDIVVEPLELSQTFWNGRPLSWADSLIVS